MSLSPPYIRTNTFITKRAIRVGGVSTRPDVRLAAKVKAKHLFFPFTLFNAKKKSSFKTGRMVILVGIQLAPSSKVQKMFVAASRITELHVPSRPSELGVPMLQKPGKVVPRTPHGDILRPSYNLCSTAVFLQTDAEVLLFLRNKHSGS